MIRPPFALQATILFYFISLCYHDLTNLFKMNRPNKNYSTNAGIAPHRISITKHCLESLLENITPTQQQRQQKKKYVN